MEVSIYSNLKRIAKGEGMNKMCFCGMSEHCGYQIETDMEQHDKAIYEQGIDEFSERLKEKLKYQCESGEFYLPYIVLYKILKIIDKFTEEMKRGV